MRITKELADSFDVKCLTLYECPFPKIRIGNKGDGGYVLANHIGAPGNNWTSGKIQIYIKKLQLWF
jgi:hypothetical protein